MLVTHLISGDLWAGAEIATYHLIRALAARADTTVRAVVLNEGELARQLALAGVETVIVPERGRSFRSLRRAVVEQLDLSDLVHAHRYKESVLAASSGLPWVATQHGRPESFGGVAGLCMGLYLGLDVALKRISARRVVAVSTEVEEWLGPRVGRAKTVCIANGIFDPAPQVAPAPWEERSPRVGVLARLVAVKGVELAIDAVARCPGLDLEIVGDGPERGALEQRVAALPGDVAARIEFAGFDPAPLSRVARWRALLVTSHHEGNPISVLEALALGTPVVSGNLRGVADILGKRGEGSPALGGWDLPDRDPQTWAAALERIAKAEPEARDASQAARARFLSAFTAELPAQKMRGVYAAALAGFPDEAQQRATRSR